MDKPLDVSAMRRCACTNIRQTDRVITQLYDGILAPSGLYSTQFALLATLVDVAPVTINRLAAVMDIDRTTLTRNLKLLSKMHLVSIEKGEDQRTRLVLLSSDGEQALKNAWPLWQYAQSRIESMFDHERFDALLTELSAIRALVR
jgi:DNA-binding MarR family transcriptional regulator